MQSYDVVGLGMARIDHVGVVDRFPDPEATVEMAGFSPQWGGAVATALTLLSNLGVSCRMIGKLADDDFGRFILRGCGDAGIDTTYVAAERECISPYQFVMVERETHRRMTLWTAGNVSAMRAEELDLSALEDTRLLIVDGHHIEAQLRAAEYVRDKDDVQVVLNAGQVIEGMGELIPLCDILVASERYASEVAPRGEIEDSLIELSQMGPETVVVKLGPEGSIGLQGEKLVRQPPLRIDVVDTTGAGDVFLGGFCYGVAKQEPLERCIQLASAAAGLSCRQIGSLASLPTLEEIEEIV
jgi:sulfofructose kinase